jgi:recombination protein RecA
MEENNVSVVIMNQIRDKIGIMYGNPETTAGGGNALPFYASLRFRTQTQKKIEEKVPGLAKKKAIGINLKIQNKKNRSVRPFIEIENIPLFFEAGINPIGGLLGALLDADRLEAGGAGNFRVKPEFIGTGESEYKFKSSLERNDVPLKVLYDNPKLVDATSSEEVKAYLEPFMAAIELSDNPDVEAFDASEGTDEEVDGLLG